MTWLIILLVAVLFLLVFQFGLYIGFGRGARHARRSRVTVADFTELSRRK